jgi:predicted amidohydrolase
MRSGISISLLDTAPATGLRSRRSMAGLPRARTPILTEQRTNPLRLAISQFGPRLGDVAGNAHRMSQIASTTDADLVIFPELSLTGYDIRDRVHDLAMPAAQLPDRLDLPKNRAAVVGFIESDEQGIPYNAAALIRGPQLLFLHRKIYLPTYGMFDEARYFGHGTRVDILDLGEFRVGLLICEDLWHPSLCYLLACQRVDAILVSAAAPGRTVRASGTGGSPFVSMDVWLQIIATTARLYGIYVVLCNRVGVESGVTFAGGSAMAGPGGSLDVSGTAEEDLLHVELHRSELTRARRPYAHLRDEQPHFVLQELQRILATNG